MPTDRELGPHDTVVLYRPVGPAELALIVEGGRRGFPPRLPGQPIFYPVLNERYARQIARDWNATQASTGYRGYVTRFRVAAATADRYPTQIVGASWHAELWVPAEELEAFNGAIVGPIDVIVTFEGGPDHAPVEVKPPAAVGEPARGRCT
jgi:hypothetical protein